MNHKSFSSFPQVTILDSSPNYDSYIGILGKLSGFTMKTRNNYDSPNGGAGVICSITNFTLKWYSSVYADYQFNNQDRIYYYTSVLL